MNARPVASGSAGSGLADPHPNEVKDDGKGAAQPGRDAKPRPWPTGVGKRRSERRGGGSALRGCRAA